MHGTAGKSRAKRGPQRNGGPRVHLQKFKKKTRLQMVQSELFWSFICEIVFCFLFFLYIYFFFFNSGATPVFLEQLAAMQQTLSKRQLASDAVTLIDVVSVRRQWLVFSDEAAHRANTRDAFFGRRRRVGEEILELLPQILHERTWRNDQILWDCPPKLYTRKIHQVCLSVDVSKLQVAILARSSRECLKLFVLTESILFVGHGRSIASDNSDYSGVRLSQNGEMQQVKTATTRDYTFMAWKMWFRNYYVAYAFV